jgi:spermidine/putrescine transport system substrate-binding protein
VLAAGVAVAASLCGPRIRHAQAALTPAPKGVLHYYNWIDYVSPETYLAFTKSTGVAVRKSYFASNEALLARLKSGARGYDLAAPTGYMVATLVREGLLQRIDWKRLPNVRKAIDSKFLGLPHDPGDRWSVTKDWGTTGFVYRTDKIKERPVSWAQFFALFAKYPRKLMLLDGANVVVGSIAVMMGYSYNTDAPAELAKVRAFVLDLKPHIHSIDSKTYVSEISSGRAYGGLCWNGDGALVIAGSPGNAADYVVAREGGEFWVDAHVIPKGAANPAAAHAWIDFVYKPKISAVETLYTYFGSPLRRSLLAPILAPTVLRDTDVFPRHATFRKLEAADLTPRGVAARERIWAELKDGA